MLTPTPTTEELLFDAKLGNDSAINELLRRESDSLHRMVQLRLDKKIQRRVGVSDVVQDALIVASCRLQKYLDAPVMPFRLWLRQIAKDRMIDAYRRHRVSAKRSVDRELDMATTRNQDDSKADMLGLLAGTGEAPDENAIREERAQQVQDSIALLPARDSEIILLRHDKSMTNQSISQLLDLSEPAASMRYLRAIRRLREIIGDRSHEMN